LIAIVNAFIKQGAHSWILLVPSFHLVSSHLMQRLVVLHSPHGVAFTI